MADNTKMEITGFDFDTVKDNLKTFMKNQNQFLDYDFEGSGINALLDVLAYNTHYLGFHANMLANEMFIDSAALRSSVVSHAKTLGYETRSVNAPKATVDIKLNDRALGTATMQAGQVFETVIDNITYQFVTTSDYSSTQTGSGITFSNIPIYEGTYITQRYTVDVNDTNQRFILTDNKADTRTLIVKVQNSSSDSTTLTYTKATDITQLTGASSVYYLQEIEDGFFEIYFGDGVVSKKVSDGNIVTLNYVVTNIAEANGAFAFTNSTAINTVTDVTVSTILSANGGAAAESIDSIKLAAPLDYAAQGRCVTANDYKVYVRKLYPNAKSIQVFGGENGSFDSSLGVVSTPEYGKVFLSVTNNLGTNLTNSEKVTLVSELSPYTVASITPVVVDPDYLYIILTASFKYNSSATTKTKDTLVAEVRTSISNYDTVELGKFDALFRHSQILGQVDNTDTSILSSTIIPRIAKYFTPVLSVATSYNLYYNNKLYYPHSGHNASSGGVLGSTGFKISGNSNEQFLDDDGKGNVRSYYLVGATRTYTNNTLGTISYTTGAVSISSTIFTAISNVDGVASSKIRLTVVPDSYDIVALRNQILSIDLVNTTVIGEIDSIATSDQGGAAAFIAAPANRTVTGTSSAPAAVETSTTATTTTTASTSTTSSSSSSSTSSSSSSSSSSSGSSGY